MLNKNSEIILCSGIKMDKEYENVLSYSESDFVALCRTNQIYNGLKYAIIQPDTIDIAASYDVCIFANYIAFINPRYGNKWFFAWVTDVRLLNPSTTRITFKVDVWSTWYSRFTIGKAFIEREHVTDDTAGKHTIPENLELGDYVVNYENKNKQFNTLNVIVASNIDPTLDANNQLIGGHVKGAVYNKIPTGFKYYYFENNSTSSLTTVLKAFDEAGAANSIIAIFLAPYNAFDKVDSTILDNGQVKQTFSAKLLDWENNITGDVAPTKLTSLDGYTPVNKKLLTFPYCYLRVSNNNGSDAIFHYEKFANVEGGYCHFQMLCSICPGMSIILYPSAYDGISSNYNESLSAGKFPTCGWASDSYTNWLTQNGVNIVSSLTGDALQIAAGAGAIASGVGASGGIYNVASGIGGIRSTLTTIYEHKFNPIQAKGNVNVGDVKTSGNLNTFTAYGMSIKKEFAKCIDQYFSRFGYQINEVKTPSLTSRTKFNFIKVGGMDELISGNIPATDLDEINRIFRKGVTIFHTYSDFGNYTVSNPVSS